MYCTHTVEPSDVSIIWNRLQSHLRLNLLVLDLFFPSNSPRCSGHFRMCVNCEVLSTGVFSLPQGKRLPRVLIYWPKLEKRFIFPRVLFYKHYAVTISSAAEDVCHHKKKSNVLSLFSGKQLFTGCTVEAAVTHLLLKKSTQKNVNCFNVFLPGSKII